MEYFPVLLKGLLATLMISLISIAIAAIPGSLVFLGKRSEAKIVRMMSTAYIELFEGIPLLAQLFFVFYVLPLLVPRLLLSTYATAIIVLTLNAIAHIASLGNAHADTFEKPMDYPNKLKVLVLVFILEFGRLIKYSTLLSVIAFADLLRSAVVLMDSANGILALVIAIIIYLILNIIIKSTYAVLKKAFFKKAFAEGAQC